MGFIQPTNRNWDLTTNKMEDQDDVTILKIVFFLNGLVKIGIFLRAFLPRPKMEERLGFHRRNMMQPL